MAKINYRKLVEKTDFDLHELLRELTQADGPTKPGTPPPFVSIVGARAYVLRVEHFQSPVDGRESFITIRYIHVSS